MVHDARQAATQLAPAALIAAVALAGCGGSSSSSSSSSKQTTTAAATIAVPAEPPPGSGANPDLGDTRLADCSMWRKGDVAERYGTIREIKSFAGSPVGGPGETGNTMSDQEAYRVFANWCKPQNTFATYFKLYKLYTRAAAFRPHH